MGGKLTIENETTKQVTNVYYGLMHGWMESEVDEKLVATTEGKYIHGHCTAKMTSSGSDPVEYVVEEDTCAEDCVEACIGAKHCAGDNSCKERCDAKNKSYRAGEFGLASSILCLFAVLALIGVSVVRLVGPDVVPAIAGKDLILKGVGIGLAAFVWLFSMCAWAVWVGDAQGYIQKYEVDEGTSCKGDGVECTLTGGVGMAMMILVWLMSAVIIVCHAIVSEEDKGVIIVKKPQEKSKKTQEESKKTQEETKKCRKKARFKTQTPRMISVVCHN